MAEKWKFVTAERLTTEGENSGPIVETRTDKMTLPGGNLFRTICTKGNSVSVSTVFIPGMPLLYR